MPQLVKKRRSGWAVLAVGAMVASILAFGAAPAAAGPQQADAQADWTACLGPAMEVEGQGFTDVSMDSVHYDNINCLRYYGITTGKTANTFDPGARVTRSQMALFLTRMAGVADIALDDDSSAGFTDLGATGADRVDAINRLANAGIMTGRTARTFEPQAQVTRADMALHLFAFLDLALDEVFIDQLPRSVDGDDAGHIELNDFDGDGNGQRVDDYFGDARQTVPAHVDNVIGAIYELGVTTGTNGRVGESGTFEPEANVTRAQMASFIMRALGHTNLRPEGLTAQQTNDHIQVSVRSADFEPVINARVEAFSTGYADSAFNSSGRCIGRYVDVDPRNSGHDECEIDGGDPLTDVDGNAELQPGLSSSLPVITCTEGTPYWYNVGVADVDPATYVLQAAGISDPEADYMLWAWTGSFGDTVGADTELFEVVPANQLVSRTRARTAVFSGGTSHDVKMGQTLNYEIQLVNQSGRPVGPNPFDDVDGDQDYIVTIEKQRVEEGDDTTAVAGSRAIVSVTQMRPDDDGKFKIVVTNPDPAAGVPNDDVRVTVTVERAEGNNLRLVDATGTAMVRRQDTDAATADTGYDGPRIDGLRATSELFSDDAPVPTKISYARASWRQFVPGANNRNSLAVTVLDQYGNPDSDFVTATFADPNDSEAVTYTSGRNGRVNFSYNFSGSSASEMITLTGGAAGADQVATVHWARINGPGEGDAGPVLIADPSTSTFVVNLVPAADQDAVPVAYPFGADDEFVVVGEAGETEEEREKPLSVEQFLEVLSVANSPDPRIGFVQAGATLEWVGFDYDRPTDGATWILRGLTCRPPAGGDEEPALNSASPASPNEMPYS
jgi:hypothetical protein